MSFVKHLGKKQNPANCSTYGSPAKHHNEEEEEQQHKRETFIVIVLHF